MQESIYPRLHLIGEPVALATGIDVDANVFIRQVGEKVLEVLTDGAITNVF